MKGRNHEIQFLQHYSKYGRKVQLTNDSKLIVYTFMIKSLKYTEKFSGYCK